MKRKAASSSKTRKRTVRRPSVKAEELTVPRKKVILVDGASFYHPKNRKQLNLGQVNWQAFVSALKEIGTGVAEDPVYTIWPSTPDYTMKSMTAAGFKLEPIHPAGEMDDHFLIRIINGLDSKEVETLVLATYDGSFVEAARAAKARGIAVWWLATDIPSFGVETKEVVTAEFNFVDFRDGIADRIRRRDWQEDSRRQPVEEKKIVVTFEAAIAQRDHVLFVTMFQPVIDRFNIKISFSS